MEDLFRRAHDVMRLLALVSVFTLTIQYAPRSQSAMDLAEGALANLRAVQKQVGADNKAFSAAAHSERAADILSRIQKASTETVRYFAPEARLDGLQIILKAFRDKRAHLPGTAEVGALLRLLHELRLLHLKSGLGEDATVALLAERTNQFKVDLPYVGPLGDRRFVMALSYIATSILLLYLIVIMLPLQEGAQGNGTTMSCILVWPGRGPKYFAVLWLCLAAAPAVLAALLRPRPVDQDWSAGAQWAIAATISLLTCVAIALALRVRRQRVTRCDPAHSS